MKLFPAIVLFTVLMVPQSSTAQHAKTIIDTSYVDELNSKAWKLRNQDLETCRSYALQALLAAQKINYIRGKSYSYNLLGHYNKVKGSYDTAFSYFQQSLTIRQQLKDTLGIASSCRNIMSIYRLQGEYEKAIVTGFKAVRLLSPMGLHPKAVKEKAWIKTNLCFLYLKTGKYDEAIRNALDAKSIFADQQDDEGLAAAAMNLGSVYEQLKAYNKALTQFQEAITISTKSDNQRELAKAYNNIGNVYFAVDSYSLALFHYKRGLMIRESNGYDDDISGSLFNIGAIYRFYNKWDSAMAYFQRSLEISVNDGNIEGQFEAHRAIGNVLAGNKNYRAAIPHFQESYALSSKSNSLPEVLILLKEMAHNYRMLGKIDSALIYSDKYSLLNDSLNEVLRSSIALEAEIKTKKYELEISEEKNRSQTYVIMLMFVAILGLTVTLLLIIRSNKAKKKVVKLEEAIKSQELATLDARVEGQEAERKRLALELHDTIGSMLSAIKYALKSLENYLTGIQHQKINTMLDETLQEVRRISHDMASSTLSEEGMTEALHHLCTTIQQSGRIQVNLDVYGFNERIDVTLERQLYRITQELLTNIIRHAHAQEISIQLIKNTDGINMVIIDDGKGFDPDNAHLKRGIGLKNIDKRVHSLSGEWEIDSGKGSGTTVIINIPITNNTI